MLTSYLIQAACANAYYSDACHKASEAFVRQAGIERDVGSMEGWSEGKVKHYAFTFIGEDGLKYGAILYGGYHIVVSRTVTLNCPTLGLANSISTDLSPSQGLLNFRWNF